MDPVAPPKADLNLAVRPQRSEPGPAAQEAERRVAEHAAALRKNAMPDRGDVKLDEGAQRFVYTLTDAETAETLRRYPSETQLAYSRAVMADRKSVV